ncbi:hypothetical protein BT67DRAFT_438307 [Trichocladium antarcticum]|uniref:Uncharacterized protein n=1 Tax=Trichocladium antarcticum TaxID=1450529 RepID=A0AAN6UTN5_9PEZI|nr:hypothetical protein BT67DRAFT_438307 [Trichocladium antarcticum]
MARYGLDFADQVRPPRPPRPFAHIRPPHHHPRYSGSRQHHRDRDRDRDRDLTSRIADGYGAVVVERQIVTDLADDFPDRPINVNFNYGPVHIHQNCSCPGSAHTCGPARPSSYDLPPARRPPASPQPLPRLPRRLSGRARSTSPGIAAGTRTPVIVSPPDSDSDVDLPSRRPASRVRRSGRPGASAPAGSVGMCEGCRMTRRLVDGCFCAECELFAEPPVPNAVPRGSNRPAGSRNGVRYVPGTNGDPMGRREREREARQMEIQREIAREIRERQRERDRDTLMRESDRARARAWMAGGYSGSARERRYFTGSGYISDSDGDTVW